MVCLLETTENYGLDYAQFNAVGLNTNIDAQGVGSYEII